MRGLTDIAGIKVGHVTSAAAVTGCTAILCEDGAVPGFEIRGAASGTEEFEVMRPGHVTQTIHAVCLAGRSAFGLEAASGVRAALEKKGVGFKTSAGVVPLVAGAIIYDLSVGDPKVRPNREMGSAAAAAASTDPVAEGCVGAGTGATVGKFYGLPCAMKGGVGSFTVELPGGVLVAALVVVNAYGDVLDPDTGKIVAGTRTAPGSSEFAGTAKLVLERGPAGGFRQGENTTLAVVATNARLDKVEASRVAALAHHGFVRAIRPVHTSMDGDLAIVLSKGTLRAPVDTLGLAASEAVARAIVRAVQKARTTAGIPGLAG
jgi:L-aminopeptidase/D-esterase-like protein